MERDLVINSSFKSEASLWPEMGATADSIQEQAELLELVAFGEVQACSRLRYPRGGGQRISC
jgi:hypothetical protein